MSVFVCVASIRTGPAVVLTQQLTEEEMLEIDWSWVWESLCHLVRIILVLFQDHMSHRRSDTVPLTQWRCRASSVCQCFRIHSVKFPSYGTPLKLYSFLTMFFVLCKNKNYIQYLYFYLSFYLISTLPSIDHIHMATIFLWCHAQGGKLNCWYNVLLLFSRLQVV